MSADVIGCLQPVSIAYALCRRKLFLFDSTFRFTNSSIVWPVLRAAISHRGCFPRPDQVSEGSYCHFLVLVPLTLATATACSIFAAWYGQTIFETQLTILTSAVALQGGYMIGLTSREFLVPSSIEPWPSGRLSCLSVRRNGIGRRQKPASQAEEHPRALPAI